MRLTVVATLVFAIALSAAAFGLVHVVHNNLVDRIEATPTTQQLDELLQRSSNTARGAGAFRPDRYQSRSLHA